jgi:PAS domain S-box-containing protein
VPATGKKVDIHQDIKNIRNEICNFILVTLSIVAIPAVIASLYRAEDFGFSASMIVQVIITGIFWLTTLLRARIPYEFRAIFVVSIMYALAVVGYFSFGLIGSGKILMLVFTILSAVFFGTKVAIFAILIGAITTAIIGGGFVEGTVSLRIDANSYNQSTNSWVSNTIAYVLFGVATAGAIVRLNSMQSNLVSKLHEQSLSLEFSQNDLERRVEQQTRALSLEVIQRKAQAIELKKNEERFKAFTEASSDRIWETDENFRFTFMSPPAGGLQKTAEELIGRAPWEVEGLTDSFGAWAEIQRNLENREPVRNIRFEYTKTGGEKTYGSYFGLPKFDSRNEFIGYRGTTQDQTEDVLLRHKAQTIEKRFYESFARLNAGFALWDPDDCLVMCNDFYRETQLEFAHLLQPGTPFRDLVHARAFSDRPSISAGQEEEWIQERIEDFQNSVSSRTFRVDQRWIESRPYKIEDGSTIIFQMDITEQNKAEAMKSDFVSLVSHELRTPLTSIYGSLKLLKNAAENINIETTTELISIAERNSQRLLSLVNDILDLQKIVAGKLELKRRIFDLNEIVIESLEENKSFAQTYRARFDFTEDEKEIFINGDSERVKQILANLLSNAAKFSPSGGIVHITLEKIDGYAVLSVRDEGPGIPDKYATEIFDPFVQIASVDTRETGGTGLGLPISKALVEEHQGFISLEPNSGAGAIFVVKFPLV